MKFDILKLNSVIVFLSIICLINISFSLSKIKRKEKWGVWDDDFPSFDLTNLPKNGEGKSKSWAKSQSYNYSNINGKVKKDFQGSELEENQEKKKGEDAKVQKYGKIYHKKNNNPTWMKEQASSTDPAENAIVSKPEVKNLSNSQEEKEFGDDDVYQDFKNAGSGSSSKSLKGLGLIDPSSFHKKMMAKHKKIMKKHNQQIAKNLGQNFVTPALDFESESNRFNSFFDKKRKEEN